MKRLLSVILICLALIVHSEQKYFYVMKVYSGDQIRVVDIDGKQFDVRLYGIDAPETDQPCGKESTKHLMQLVKTKKFVHLEDVRFFKDGNAEATIFLHGLYSNSNINEAMVESGMAWDVSKDSRYANEQKEAKTGRLGLWGFFPQIKPSEWRKNHPCVLARISMDESEKLIPPQSAWTQFFEQERKRAKLADDEKQATERFEREHKVENELKQFPSSRFEGWADLSIKSIFGVELGADYKDLSFDTKRLDPMETIRVYGCAFPESYAFTPKKQFRGFKDYRIIFKRLKVVAIRAELMIKDDNQVCEDLATLKKILEHKYGIALRKAPVPGEESYVYSGTGKDYTLLRLRERKSSEYRFLMIELKLDGGRLNKEAAERKSEKEKNVREREAKIQKEKEQFEGIDAL